LFYGFDEFEPVILSYHFSYLVICEPKLGKPLYNLVNIGGGKLWPGLFGRANEENQGK
jgi:hypothetical protein